VLELELELEFEFDLLELPGLPEPETEPVVAKDPLELELDDIDVEPLRLEEAPLVEEALVEEVPLVLMEPEWCECGRRKFEHSCSEVSVSALALGEALPFWL
jgi:hypothetical protein